MVLIKRSDMEISDLLAHDAVVAKLNVSSKKQLLQELARIAAPAVDMDERAIFDTLLERERLGTTGVGSVDPLPEILELQAQYGFRVHVDSAYGGYFGLVDNLESDARAAYDALDRVDSIVIDPHKHGLQPYGCGCVLFKDPAVGRFYQHDSPYTYFSSDELHLGEITLECSRAGASAVALWATQRLLPLVPGGDFARDLGKGREAALTLYRDLSADDRYLTLMAPELDILIWAPVGASASQISERARLCFHEAAKANLHLALLELPADSVQVYWGDRVSLDAPTVTCLRSTLMKPEHLDWQPQIRAILDRVTEACLRHDG